MNWVIYIAVDTDPAFAGGKGILEVELVSREERGSNQNGSTTVDNVYLNNERPSSMSFPNDKTTYTIGCKYVLADPANPNAPTPTYAYLDPNLDLHEQSMCTEVVA